MSNPHSNRSKLENEIEPFLDRVHHGDCLDVMRAMPAGSVDLVVTSPPYNLRNTTGGFAMKGITWKTEPLKSGYDGYSDDLPHHMYVDWQRCCLSEMMRLLSPSGAIFYNHQWRQQDKLLQDRSDILEGFPVRQIIIWNRGGGVLFNRAFFTPFYQVVYMITKPDFKLLPKMSRFGDVWNFPYARNNPHPAPFPLALPMRCITSTDANVILDPFMGSGTTAIAAMRAGRQWIGIEKSAEYCRMADERIALEARRPSLFAGEEDQLL